MVAEDKQEKERVDARNALEEYVYDLRSKLLDDDQLATFVTDSDREEICRLLDETENWLYEEGEECQRQVYSDRLARLKVRYLFSKQNKKHMVSIFFVIGIKILDSFLVIRRTNKR